MLGAVPRSARLSATQRLTVVSYNLLAPVYVRPIDERTGTVQAFAAFAWCDDEALAWELRQPRMLAALRQSEADVICLQEVQFEAVASAADETFGLPAWLHLDGYQAVIPSQRPLKEMALRNERVLRQRVPVGNALLYRSDRLEVIGDADALPAKATEQSTTRVGACVRGKAGGGLERLGRLALYSVHLDATAEDKRVKALAKCIESAKTTYGTRSVLIAGDLNTELLRGSATAAMLACRAGGAGAEGELECPSEEELERECVRALRITDGGMGAPEEDHDANAAVAVSDPQADGSGGGEGGGGGEVGGGEASPRATTVQLAAWRALHELARAVPSQTRIALHRAPTGPTRAAYTPGATAGPCVGWALDHVLYTPRALRLATYWETLEAHPDALAAGLPTTEWPSDHLAIGASFEPLEVESLAPAAEEALLARVSSLLAAQAQERAMLSAAISVEVEQLEQTERDVAAAAAAAATNAAADDDGAAADGAAAADADVAPAASKKAKKRQKGKGGPPSVAMQAMLRSKRERERNLKAVQRAARVALLATLTDPEQDALEAASVDLAGE